MQYRYLTAHDLELILTSTVLIKESTEWEKISGFIPKLVAINALSQQCEIAPPILAAFSLKVTSNNSAIHFCCSFNKDLLFYMGGAVSQGPVLV